MDIYPFPETRDDRERLLTRAECMLFELALSEPTGQLANRREILTQAAQFVDYLRTRILPKRTTH